MARAKIESGICGFVTEVVATSEDRQHVRLKVTSTCPDVLRASKKLNAAEFDAYTEIGPCAQPGSIYETGIMAICGALPHVACPVPSGICKAIEVAAGLALPHDAHILLSADNDEQ